MDFFLQQQMPRSDVSTIVGFVPQKGHYGVAHVCGDPDKRAVLDDRPNRAEPTSPPPSITVAAHNPTYARRTTRGGLVASLAALQPTFSVFGAMASKPTVSPRAAPEETPQPQSARVVNVPACGWPLTTAGRRASAAFRLPPRVARQSEDVAT